LPLTRAELDVAQCSNPDCTEEHGPLILHSRCHTGVPTWATYEAGVLTITCAECGQEVTAVTVAP